MEDKQHLDPVILDITFSLYSASCHLQISLQTTCCYFNEAWPKAKKKVNLLTSITSTISIIYLLVTYPYFYEQQCNSWLWVKSANRQLTKPYSIQTSNCRMQLKCTVFTTAFNETFLFYVHCLVINSKMLPTSDSGHFDLKCFEGHYGVILGSILTMAWYYRCRMQLDCVAPSSSFAFYCSPCS